MRGYSTAGALQKRKALGPELLMYERYETYNTVYRCFALFLVRALLKDGQSGQDLAYDQDR